MQLRVLASYRPPEGKQYGLAPLRVGTGRNFNGEYMLQVELYYRRLLIAGPLLLVAGYLSLTGGLYGWLAQKPHNQIAWRDLALPWHWRTLNTKRGDAAVLSALDDLRARKYADAFYNLRVGLARSPGNVTGRLTLAQLLALGEPAQAVRLMEEGIPAAVGDDRFVAGLLDLYARQQIHAHALVTIETLRAQPALTPTGRLLVERTRFSLRLQLGQRAEAEAGLPEIRALSASEAVRCELELRIKQRQWPAARQIFETHYAADLPPEALTPLAVELAVGLGEAEWVQRVVRRLKRQAPEATGPHLLALQAWHRMNRPSLRDAAEREYYELFAGNEAALQALGTLAVQLQLPDLLGRARLMARDHGFSGFAFEVHQTELALRRQQWAQASQALAAWEKGIETLPASQRGYPELINHLARAAAAGTPEESASLVTYLAANRTKVGLPVYLLVTEVLEKAGLWAVAAQVLAIAQPLYPQSDPLLERQRGLAARLEEMTPVRPVMLPPAEMAVARSPTRVAAAEQAAQAERAQARRDELAEATVTPDAAWAALDRVRAHGDRVEAESLLKYLRETPPAWVAGATTELKVREVGIRLALDQRPLALAGLKELVSKGGVARGAAFKLVRDLVAREDHETARLLAREIGRLLPGDAAAARLLKETEAAAAPP